MRFGELFDGLPAHAIKAVDLNDLPVLGLRVIPGALLVMLGAIAAGLVLGGDADPDANGLGFGLFLLDRLGTRGGSSGVEYAGSLWRRTFTERKDRCAADEWHRTPDLEATDPPTLMTR